MSQWATTQRRCVIVYTNGDYIQNIYKYEISPQALRREIERRLDCIQKIAQEPKLLWNDDKYILQRDKPLPPYYYRMQAVDDIKLLGILL